MTRAAAAPTDFRFDERRDGRVARAVRRTCRVAFGFDPAPDDGFVDAFAAAYFEGDPIAEAFVRACSAQGARGGLGEARRRLDVALADLAAGRSPELAADPPLRALLEDALLPPTWLDRERFALGAETFRRYGSLVFRFAGAITLAGYRESSVAKPLVLSGAYVGDSTRARFLETASFWIEVSEPGGLDAGAPGFAAALRVRVLHASVRVRLDGHAAWDHAAWGVPINTGDALLTLLGGSLAPGLGLRVLGFRTTREEIEALLHFWRAVGHVMGVRFTRFPETLEGAVRLAYVAALKGSNGAGEDGRKLCRSYARAFARRDGDGPLGWLEDAFHRGMTGLFLPPPLHRQQGLGSPGLTPLVPLAAAPWIFAAETARLHVPGVAALLDRAARAERRSWLSRHAKRGKGFGVAGDGAKSR